MSNPIELRYGALFNSIEEQLNEQGFTLGKDSEKIEEIRHSIFVLMFNHIATSAQCDSMFKKLHNTVMAKIKPLRGEECLQ